MEGPCSSKVIWLGAIVSVTTSSLTDYQQMKRLRKKLRRAQEQQRILRTVCRVGCERIKEIATEMREIQKRSPNVLLTLRKRRAR